VAATVPLRVGVQERSIGLIGGFSVRRQLEALDLPHSARRVLAFLAMKPKPLSRMHVAGVLWPDSSDNKAVANLRTTLWRIRQTDAHLVDSTPSHLSLASDIAVDLRQASGVAHRVLARPHEAMEEDLAQLPLGGELLPDWYDEWLVVERERFRQLRLHALEALCDALAARGSYARALEAGLAAVELDPLRESAHRTLMRAHIAEGNISEARRELEGFCSLLQSTLGVPPSPRLRDMASELRIPWRVRDANG
jgi:DNA-binding SARP family transcriptional activator